jgi:DNA (cytosine-5)-methyltransferase 1
MPSPKVIDLFCGAGGFSLGARLAGCELLASVDVDKTLTSSYKSNFPGANLQITDISKLNPKRLLEDAGANVGEIDGIIGGPPCQGFSTIGKRNLTDPRNSLLNHFFRIVAETKPRFFIMENVPGLIAGKAKKTLDRAMSLVSEYTLVGPLGLDAREFGAPTHRRRIILLGYDAKRMGAITLADIASLVSAEKPTVRDAISDLPEAQGSSCARYPSRRTISSYALRARSAPREGLGSPAARERMKQGVVSGVQKTKHALEVVNRFRMIEEGKTDPVSRCMRLKWKAAAPTLRAGTGPDRGSFQSVRPIHPSRPRVITVREAARLQGFPDWFELHETKWHSFRMVGNSVSPIMAEALVGLVVSKIPKPNIESDGNAGSTCEN